MLRNTRKGITAPKIMPNMTQTSSRRDSLALLLIGTGILAALSLASIPRTAAAVREPTAQPTPTIVPTYVPFAGAPVVFTPTPNAIPTPFSAEPLPQPNSPPIPLTLMLAAACCILVLLISVLGLGVYLASEKRKGENDEQGS